MRYGQEDDNADNAEKFHPLRAKTSRLKIEMDTAIFKKSGGVVKIISMGVTGRDYGDTWLMERDKKNISKSRLKGAKAGAFLKVVK